MIRDYDYTNRLNNLKWTISGSYDGGIEGKNSKSNHLMDLAVYMAVQSGAREKYADWNLVKKYIGLMTKRGANPEILVPLVELCTDIMVEEKLIEDRPGVTDLREAAFKDLIHKFLVQKNSSLMLNVLYAYAFEKLGKSVQFDKDVKDILLKVKSCSEIMGTEDLIAFINEIYFKFFDVDCTNEYQTENIVEEVKNYDSYTESDDSFGDFLYEELFDGEFNVDASTLLDKMDESGLSLKGDSVGTSNANVFIDEEMSKKIYEKICYYYGKSSLDRDEIREIERAACTGIHKGCRVHLTDGVLRTENDNAFQKKFVLRQRQNNQDYYASNSRVNKRNILRLKQIIRQTMTAESQVNSIPSESGQLVPTRLWKVGRTRDYKVFDKIVVNEKGGYVVDILLDASGSQRSNQGKVATQAFIISEALTLVNIPNRVMGFSSFLDYTILRRYRDYNSPISENSNIFEYYSVGSNRDGLALRAVTQGILKRHEENKIIIVLSDGKPNDIKISKASQSKMYGLPAYKGTTAIKDTAYEVRRARQKGIMVLGVFTGREEELYSEKLIYGKDFIYTKTIERFSDIVGSFLKRVIEN